MTIHIIPPSLKPSDSLRWGLLTNWAQGAEWAGREGEAARYRRLAAGLIKSMKGAPVESPADLIPASEEWTTAQENHLLRLRELGVSYTGCANKTGRSRSACIAKMGRLRKRMKKNELEKLPDTEGEG